MLNAYAAIRPLSEAEMEYRLRQVHLSGEILVRQRTPITVPIKHGFVKKHRKTADSDPSD